MELTNIHHIGIAVESIEKSIPFYTDVLGMTQHSAIVEDPIQKVKVVLLRPNSEDTAATQIELIEEIETPSPISNVLRQRNRLYHYCFEVEDIEKAVEVARKERLIVLGDPVPARLFQGRRIVFLFSRDRYLIELLEQEG